MCKSETSSDFFDVFLIKRTIVLSNKTLNFEEMKPVRGEKTVLYKNESKYPPINHTAKQRRIHMGYKRVEIENKHS